MAITLATVSDQGILMQGLVLALVAVGITPGFMAWWR
jgi:hypothetical protein